MQIKRSWLFAAIILLIIGGTGWTIWDLQPSHQLQKRFTRLLQAAGDRQWPAVRESLAADYHDSWGMDRDTALRAAQTVCGQFFALEITPQDVKVSLNGTEATVTCHLQLAGQGTALAQEAIQQANALHDEFQFAWSRKSWKPWDWKLQSVRQNEIQFDPSWIQ